MGSRSAKLQEDINFRIMQVFHEIKALEAQDSQDLNLDFEAGYRN